MAAGDTGGAAGVGARCRIDIDDEGFHSWRLTAQNGRTVAVGATAYPDYGECLRAFGRLCAGSEGLPGGVQHAADSNGWVWRLRGADGQTVAVSSRAYERHSTCQTAYDRFRALLAEIGAAEASANPTEDAPEGVDVR